MKLDVRLEQIRSCVVLKDAIAKNFVANEHHSFTSVFTFSVVVVDLPIDCILTFLFAAETDVLVPVFSQSTDVVVVNFVVVLKFPNMLKSASNKCGFRPTTLKDFKIACSQTLWFLFENRRACVYENVNRAEARFLRLRAHQIVNRL